MGWTAPTDRTTGYNVTAVDWNIVEDNLTFLAGTAGAIVDTSQATASTSFTDLATVGPAVTLTTGANALVILTCQASDSTAGATACMSFAVSGASTVAAADNSNISITNTANNTGTLAMVQTGLTPGSNTFTAKYRVTSGTGTFMRRKITVIPLP